MGVTMSREKLVAMAERTIAHNKAGTVHLTESVTTIPATNYFDPERWQREVDMIFKRVPLLLAMTAEIKEVNTYKAIDVVGMPVLISRGADGIARAFVNMCSHRGAQLVDPGVGTARRFACPYHNWTYNQEGDLVGVFKQLEINMHTGDYSWIGRQKRTHKKLICQRTKRATTDWRPRTKSARQGESIGAAAQALSSFFGKLFMENR